ncbi:hypothetical protein [Parendozoicomonas haliclonae]|uniref:Uncharacterized protein n=1 Tax=Parendozoicomonas haliclonae TaxID=1960125 RepID=A0A1X7AGP6_9GAMM|nr:hypothetical protein [Parendozoicomonas haliclonae]SMA33487.1 hypothetical protein EHSB41UT_00289 [Parendozoicomonas haliclonae]
MTPEAPSIKKLVEFFGIDKTKARSIREVCKTGANAVELSLTAGVGFPQTASWLKDCWHLPKKREIQFKMLQEALEAPNDSIRVCPVLAHTLDAHRFECVDMADPYVRTIIFDYEKNRWFLGTWGDLVEKYEPWDTII